MFRLSFRVFALAVSVAATCTVTAVGDDDALTLNRISGYRQWTKVNPEPVKVDTPSNTNLVFLAGG
jgi:hypothetical protein